MECNSISPLRNCKTPKLEIIREKTPISRLKKTIAVSLKYKEITAIKEELKSNREIVKKLKENELKAARNKVKLQKENKKKEKLKNIQKNVSSFQPILKNNLKNHLD